ncbi:MAG: exo-alpha-sialidase [Verrucomicrobia bacterium]|nr:exo-alpha-sialidase [Verrucomicrobiota bacterium]
MKMVLSLAFAACVAANAAEPVTIVAFGDSTTALRGSLTVYATILQEELRGVRVINAGVGGHTTEMARARFEKDVLAHKPAVAIIQFGINDAAVDVWKKPPATRPRVTAERYEANLRHFTETLKSAGARVILMTPNPVRWTPKLKEMYGKPPYKPDDPDGFNILLDGYADIVRKVARETGAALVDAREAFVAQGRKPGETVDALLLDGMHPNDRGQRLVAELLMDHLLAMAKKDGLPIGEGARWKPSGGTVLLNPLCTDITHDAPHPVVLGCGLAKLADGAVMTVYSTPSSYYSPPGSTYIACRVTRDGGKTWSPEREITRHSDCQASHASVLRTRDGTIHAFYLGFVKHSWKNGNPTPEEKSDVWAIRSTDGGKTWTNRQAIFRGYSGATNGAIETRDGHILVPYSHYVSNPGRLVSRVSVSTDGGKTWKLSTALDIGGAGDHEGALEPALLELKDGRVWMLIRTSRGQFWESFSTDGGLTWSEAKPTAIESTHAPGHLARLADGRIALVWNQCKKGRGELHLAFSGDEGRTWTPSLVLAKGKQVTYPFAIEIEPGDLWIGYHDVPKGWMFPRARHLRVSSRINSKGASNPAETR